MLESVLSKQEYLCSNKLTIADLSFVTWYVLLPFDDRRNLS